MNKQILIVPVLGLTLAAAQPAFAGGSSQAVSAGIDHASQAVGYSVIGGAQVSAGVAAVPLKAAGAMGQMSGQAGDSLWKIANEPIGTPLPVTDETLTAGPDPAQEMRKEGAK